MQPPKQGFCFSWDSDFREVSSWVNWNGWPEPQLKQTRSSTPENRHHHSA